MMAPVIDFVFPGLAEQPNDGADVDPKVRRHMLTQTCCLNFWGVVWLFGNTSVSVERAIIYAKINSRTCVLTVTATIALF
jgi:hypothetical protein